MARDINTTQLDASRIKNLASEIQKLISCVYSPSLQSLEKAIRCCNPAEISLWATYEKERSVLLVEAVLNSLERDQSAVKIIQYLSADDSLRDFMLEQKPQLLDGLLRASIVNDRAFEKYSEAACALLQHDLPTEFMPPASLSNFVVLLIQMVQKNELRHLTLLESVLRGNAHLIMQSISFNQQYALTSALAGLLAAKSSQLVLLALSSLASISRLQAYDNSGQVNQTTSLFCKDKGLKVLRLIASTISSRLSGDLLDDDYSSWSETICLKNVIETVDRATVLDWLSRKEGSITIRKLLDKLELQMDNYRVQNAAQCLAALLRDIDEGVMSLTPVATKIVENTIGYTTNDNLTSEVVTSMQVMFPFGSPCLESITSLTHHLLKYASNCSSLNMSWENRINFQYYSTILQGLSSTTRLHNLLAEALVQSENLQILHAIVLIDATREPEKNDFMRNLARLILELLDGLVFVQKIIPQPQTHNLTKQTSFALQQAANTPYSGFGSKNWRDNLMVDLQTEAAHQHSRIVARVDAICGDLQHRADTVEEPLREAEAQLEQVRMLNERLKAENAEAALELQQHDVEHQSFYEERQRLQHTISEMLHEIEFSSNRIKILENNEAVLIQEVAQREAEVQAQSASADQLSQMMRDRCAALEAEVATMSDELSTKARENDTASREIAAKQGTIESLQKEVQHYTTQLKDSEESKEQLRQFSEQQLETLQCQLQEKDVAVVNLEGNIDELKHDLQTASDQHNEDVNKLMRAGDDKQKLKSLLEETKLLADERFALQDESFQNKSRELEDELRQTRERHTAAIVGHEREIDTLRQTLARVRTSYEKRCEDFQKAQELSRRLMAVMGGGLLPSSAPSQPPQDSPTKASDEAVSRHKRPSHIVRASEDAQDQDLTMDVTFDARTDKENMTTAATSEKRRAARKSMRKEDSAILSELSGLGIQ